MTLEEWAAEHGADPGAIPYLQLMAAAHRLPHRIMLGRIYVNEAEMAKWERNGATGLSKDEPD